ncbi:MAG: hypothetical protein HOI23_14175, partial [Deltaproteobacteria bacterium]|nr:hypothetical protein [Deltaproteobacteria bacterium]
MSRLLIIAFLLCVGCGEEALYGIPNEEPSGQEVPTPEAETEIPPPPADQPGFDEAEPEADPEPEDETDAPEEVDAPPPPPDDCEGISDLIYVIDKDNDSLYIFDPENNALNFHGALDCALFSGTPASMSVARNGYAYIRYADNTVYSVHLETMTCTETAYSVDFGAFGMG